MRDCKVIRGLRYYIKIAKTMKKPPTEIRGGFFIRLMVNLIALQMVEWEIPYGSGHQDDQLANTDRLTFHIFSSRT